MAISKENFLAVDNISFCQLLCVIPSIIVAYRILRWVWSTFFCYQEEFPSREYLAGVSSSWSPSCNDLSLAQSPEFKSRSGSFAESVDNDVEFMKQRMQKGDPGIPILIKMILGINSRLDDIESSIQRQNDHHLLCHCREFNSTTTTYDTKNDNRRSDLSSKPVPMSDLISDDDDKGNDNRNESRSKTFTSFNPDPKVYLGIPVGIQTDIQIPGGTLDRPSYSSVTDPTKRPATSKKLDANTIRSTGKLGHIVDDVTQSGRDENIPRRPTSRRPNSDDHRYPNSDEHRRVDLRASAKSSNHRRPNTNSATKSDDAKPFEKNKNSSIDDDGDSEERRAHGPKVLVIHDSTFRYVDNRRLNRAYGLDAKKRVAYKVEDVDKVLREECSTSSFDAIYIHTAVNNLKNEDPEKVVEKMKVIVSNFHIDFPTTKIVISRVAPTLLSSLENKRGIYNAVLVYKFQNMKNVYLQNHENLWRFHLHKDGIHPRPEGSTILAKNVGRCLHGLFFEMSARQARLKQQQWWAANITSY